MKLTDSEDIVDNLIAPKIGTLALHFRRAKINRDPRLGRKPQNDKLNAYLPDGPVPEALNKALVHRVRYVPVPFY